MREKERNPRRAARCCAKYHSRKRKCVGEGTAWKQFRKERIQETVGEALVLGPVSLGTNKAWDFHTTDTPACRLSWALPLGASFPRSPGLSSCHGWRESGCSVRC